MTRDIKGMKKAGNRLRHGKSPFCRSLFLQDGCSAAASEFWEQIESGQEGNACTSHPQRLGEMHEAGAALFHAKRGTLIAELAPRRRVNSDQQEMIDVEEQ